MAVDLLTDLAGEIDLRIGSVEDASAVEAAFAAVAPRTVVWCAGHNQAASGLMASGETDTARSLLVNGGGFFAVLDAARRHGVQRVVAAGSVVVYGPAHLYARPRIQDDAPLCPTTGYGLAKCLSEQIGNYFRHRYALEVVSLRLAVVLGSGRWYGGVAQLLSRMLADARSGAWARYQAPAEALDWIHARDAASAFCAALEADHALAPAYHVSAFCARFGDLLDEIKAHFPGWHPELQEQPSPLVFPLMDCTAIERELDFCARFDRTATIRELVAVRS
jgi:nucleoside-diphosphate-sugar epimerase